MWACNDKGKFKQLSFSSPTANVCGANEKKGAEKAVETDRHEKQRRLERAKITANRVKSNEAKLNRASNVVQALNFLTAR